MSELIAISCIGIGTLWLLLGTFKTCTLPDMYTKCHGLFFCLRYALFWIMVGVGVYFESLGLSIQLMIGFALLVLGLGKCQSQFLKLCTLKGTVSWQEREAYEIDQ
jgi:multisubunit Na+/H+ antiporter MnhG subunit